MKNELLIRNIKFWVDQNIIHCEMYSGFEKTNSEREIEEIFVSAVTILSNSKFLPILINLRKIDHSLSVKTFKFLSNSQVLKALVLSKTFLVNSYKLKILLFLYNFTTILIVPNTIYKNYDLAIKDCIKNYMLFNPLSLRKN